MSSRTVLLSSTFLSGLACGLIASSAALAESSLFAPSLNGLPAVDGVNGKAELVGGSFARQGLYGAAGSVAVPVSGQFGAQFDGGIGSFADHLIASGAGHLFWRDPSRGLLGLYGDHTHWDNYGGVHVSHVAGEGEAYFGRWTLYGLAGVEFGNNSASITSSTVSYPSGGTTATVVTTSGALADVTRFFDRVTLSYYVTDDWKASIGHRYLGGRHALTLGTEYAMPIAGRRSAASLFAQARIGEGSNNNGIWGGVRFYFGKSDKSLIRRHREDDPIGDSSAEPLVDIAESLGPITTSVSCANPGEYYPVGNQCVAAAPSDIRLKRDIALLARLDNGIGLYRYRYLWSDTVYVGVMAQEVADIVPDAVFVAVDGFYRVDYGRLGLRLQTWDQWIADGRAALPAAA